MAYLRVMFDDTEIDRRDLADVVVIGRSPECDVGVRDILLSRRHCRIEPVRAFQTESQNGVAQEWRVVDLASKNGTTLNDRALDCAEVLADGDILKLGRVRLLFGAGILAESGFGPLRASPLRPVDPMEALSGTLCGYQYLEAGESAPALCNRPTPRPEPPAPAAYAREDVYSLLNSLASSSWDSIYEQAKLPVLAIADSKEDGVPRPRSPMDLSLQVDAEHEAMAVEMKPVMATFQTGRNELRRHVLRYGGGRYFPLARGVIWSIAVAVLILKRWMMRTASQTEPQAAMGAETRPTATPADRFVTNIAGDGPTFHSPLSDAPDRPIDPRWSAAIGVTTAAIPWLF